MTQNAIACLEECYFLNHNLASNRALDFAWIFFFFFIFFILTDIPVSPTNI